MSDFSQADSSVYSTFLEMISKTFPELSNFSFGLLFRNKIKKSKGRITLAEIALPGKLLSYYAKNDDGTPFDFLLIVDEMIWACARPDDRIRLVRHELRHVFISEKGAPKLIDHDFADFHVEVELNVDDPNWANKLCEIAEAGYKQVKDGQKDPRIDRVDAEDLVPVTKSPQRQVQLEAAGMATDKLHADGSLKDDAGVTVKINIADGEVDEGPFNTTEPIETDNSLEKFPEIDEDNTLDNSLEKFPEIDGGDILGNLQELARKKGLLKEEATA